MVAGEKSSSDGGEKTGGAIPLPARIIMLVIGLGFVGVGLAGFYGITLLPAFEYMGSSDWSAVPCVVTTSEVQETSKSGKKTEYLANIAYIYEYEGNSYSSNCVSIGRASTVTELDEVRAIVERYPMGAKLNCLVNPDDPADATLEREYHSSNIGAGVLFLFFLLIGLIPLYFALLWKPKDKKITAEAPAKTTHAFGKRLVPFVFFFIFFSMGLLFVWMTALRPLARHVDAQDWVETPCTILSSQVYSRRSSGKHRSTSYGVDIRYTYVWQGREYEADTYDVYSGTTTGGSTSKEEIVEKHPHGSKSVCFVNPDNPREALLDRALGSSIYIGFLPLIFVLVGVVGIVATLRGKIDMDRKTGEKRQLQSSMSKDSRFLERAIFGSKTSRKKELVGNWFITIVASVFVYLFVGGNIGVFFSSPLPMIFAGIPLAIGVYAWFKAVRSTMAYSNPRIEVVVTPGTVTLGSKAKLEWKVDGGKREALAMTIDLFGKVWEGGGKKRRRTVYEKQLHTTSHKPGIKSGEVEFEIPKEVPAGEDDEIDWFVVVRLDIPNWPDTKDEFKLNVAENAGEERV